MSPTTNSISATVKTDVKIDNDRDESRYSCDCDESLSKVVHFVFLGEECEVVRCFIPYTLIISHPGLSYTKLVLVPHPSEQEPPHGRTHCQNTDTTPHARSSAQLHTMLAHCSTLRGCCRLSLPLGGSLSPHPHGTLASESCTLPGHLLSLDNSK